MTRLNDAKDIYVGADPALSVNAGDEQVWPEVAPVEFVEAKGAQAAASSVTVTLDSAPQAGDFLYAADARNSGGSGDLPSGFTYLGTGNSYWSSGWKIADGSEGTSFVFSGSLVNRAAFIHVYRNVDQASPIIDSHYETALLSGYSYPALDSLPDGVVMFGIGGRGDSGNNPVWSNADEVIRIVDNKNRHICSAHVLGVDATSVSGVSVSGLSSSRGVSAISLRPA